ncbi:MAG: peroxiredoxin [Phycisphaera sp.]|nr:peroxiredoxin [Phycisphaera sp.]
MNNRSGQLVVCAVAALAAVGWLSPSRAVAVVSDVRTIDGSGNNLTHTDWGMAGSQLARLLPATYADGYNTPITIRPSAREISNKVAAQVGSKPNAHMMSDLVWQWGQFLDHDIDLSPTGNEAFNIPVPTGDPYFDPFSTGTQTIALNRSTASAGTGVPGTPREQINNITSYIDASNVYGSDSLRADALRAHTGGLMATSSGDLLPFNTLGLPNAGGTGSDLFLAGDERANEQVGLTAMHTLFVREHNRLANLIATTYNLDPVAYDETIFQAARKIVAAEVQHITYQEFLPTLLGSAAPKATDYLYDPSVDATILNEFSTAAYRLGHTMLSSTLQLKGADGSDMGTVNLLNSFFNPGFFQTASGGDPLNVERLLNGMAHQSMQTIDNQVVDDVRNFLFGPPGSSGFDLASLNIQRGRDHGLPDYNSLRQYYGLAPLVDFSDLTSDPVLAADLLSLYGNVDNIDLWVGLLTEDHMQGAEVGSLMAQVLIDQFTRLRDGDRFFYIDDPDLLMFQQDGVFDLNSVCLSSIIMDNTNIHDMQLLAMFVTDTVSVPEPLTASLGAMGLVGLALSIRRRKP